MAAEILVILIQSVLVPIITELVKTALKKLSSSKELKELEAGLHEIKSTVDLETRSLRRDPKDVMGSLRRLKGAAEATESILGDSRATGIAMGCSIDYLSGKTQLLPQGSEGILPSLCLIVQGMESDLQKANVEATDTVRQTLRRVVESAASPAVELREVRQGPRREKALPQPAEELEKENICHRTASEPQEEKCLCMPVKESPEGDQSDEGKSLRKHDLSKPAVGNSLRKPAKEPLPSVGNSLRKPAKEPLPSVGNSLRKPAKEPLPSVGNSLRKPAKEPLPSVGNSLRKPEEEPLEEKSLDERKSHRKAVSSKPATGPSLRREPN